MAKNKVSFRPITDNDMLFLEKLYASTRWEELQAVPWTKQQKNEFLKFQFTAQHQHYMKYFTDASFDIILKSKAAIGRLYIDRRADEIRIVDIALLPQYRNQGIGSKILRDILAEGQASKLRVGIHVEHNNLAMRLYQRMGFKKVAEEGVYWLMEWSPE